MVVTTHFTDSHTVRELLDWRRSSKHSTTGFPPSCLNHWAITRRCASQFTCGSLDQTRNFPNRTSLILFVHLAAPNQA